MQGSKMDCLYIKKGCISATFMIDIFHSKSEHEQVQGNKIKGETCTSDSSFSYLQSNTLFEWFLKLISW